MILTDEQELVRSTAADFAASVVTLAARDWEREGRVPADVRRQMGELGFLGMTVPEPLGGAGLDYVSYAAALIEIAAGDGGLSTLMSVNNAPVCAILQREGTPQQQARWLGPLARGEMIGAFALTEPQAGSRRTTTSLCMALIHLSVSSRTTAAVARGGGTITIRRTRHGGRRIEKPSPGQGFCITPSSCWSGWR